MTVFRILSAVVLGFYLSWGTNATPLNRVPAVSPAEQESRGDMTKPSTPLAQIRDCLDLAQAYNKACHLNDAIVPHFVGPTLDSNLGILKNLRSKLEKWKTPKDVSPSNPKTHAPNRYRIWELENDHPKTLCPQQKKIADAFFSPMESAASSEDVPAGTSSAKPAGKLPSMFALALAAVAQKIPAADGGVDIVTTASSVGAGNALLSSPKGVLQNSSAGQKVVVGNAFFGTSAPRDGVFPRAEAAAVFGWNRCLKAREEFMHKKQCPEVLWPGKRSCDSKRTTSGGNTTACEKEDRRAEEEKRKHAYAWDKMKREWLPVVEDARQIAADMWVRKKRLNRLQSILKAENTGLGSAPEPLDSNIFAVLDEESAGDDETDAITANEMREDHDVDPEDPGRREDRSSRPTSSERARSSEDYSAAQDRALLQEALSVVRDLEKQTENVFENLATAPTINAQPSRKNKHLSEAEKLLDLLQESSSSTSCPLAAKKLRQLQRSLAKQIQAEVDRFTEAQDLITDKIYAEVEKSLQNIWFDDAGRVLAILDLFVIQGLEQVMVRQYD